MTRLHVLKVFVGEDGAGGNPLGVFVEDAAGGRLRIFTPGTELPFAGHPLVGTAWLLASEGLEVPALRPPAGEVSVRFEDDLTFISGRPEWAPGFEHFQLSSPVEVDALAGPPEGHDLAGAWAWEDEEAGRVRVRVFAPRVGVDEDEATGAHAVRLAALLGREIRIRQGEGSLILAKPRRDGTVEIGGRTEPVEVRDYQGGSA